MLQSEVIFSAAGFGLDLAGVAAWRASLLPINPNRKLLSADSVQGGRDSARHTAKCASTLLRLKQTSVNQLTTKAK